MELGNKLALTNPGFFRNNDLLTMTTSIDSLAPDCPIFPVMLAADRAPWTHYHNIVGVVPQADVPRPRVGRRGRRRGATTAPTWTTSLRRSSSRPTTSPSTGTRWRFWKCGGFCWSIWRCCRVSRSWLQVAWVKRFGRTTSASFGKRSWPATFAVATRTVGLRTNRSTCAAAQRVARPESHRRERPRLAAGASSMSALTSTKRPAHSPASFSKSGASRRQGWHQAAWKSSTTSVCVRTLHNVGRKALVGRLDDVRRLRHSVFLPHQASRSVPVYTI